MRRDIQQKGEKMASIRTQGHMRDNRFYGVIVAMLTVVLSIAVAQKPAPASPLGPAMLRADHIKKRIDHQSNEASSAGRRAQLVLTSISAELRRPALDASLL